MSYTGTSDIPSFAPNYLRAEPWDSLEVYRKHSPVFNVKGVSTPTLIQHGQNDVRFSISQGYELYNALKWQDCTAKMVVYPRMGHGTDEPRQKPDMMRRSVEWFDEYLAKGKPVKHP